jgi:hypothetical protein
MAYRILMIALIAGTSLLLMSACASEDRENAETEQNQVQPETLFENEFAHVVKVSLEPGQELASHEGSDRVIYSLHNYTIEWIVNGESEGEKSWSEGDVHVHGTDTHSAVNIGSAEAEFLAFTRKAGLPDVEMQSLENDVTTLDGDFAEVIFDNELFRVTEVTLASGESIPSRLVMSQKNQELLRDHLKPGMLIGINRELTGWITSGIPKHDFWLFHTNRVSVENYD